MSHRLAVEPWGGVVDRMPASVPPDAQAAYDAGKFYKLVEFMSPAQVARLRQEAIRHVLPLVDFALSGLPSGSHPAEHRAVDVVRRWLDSPASKTSGEAWQTLLDSGRIRPIDGDFPQFPDYESVDADPLTEVVLCFAFAVSLDIGVPAHLLSRVAALIAGQTEALMAHPSAENPSTLAEWLERLWQLEAAWSILHDEPIKPLPPDPIAGAPAAYRAGETAVLVNLMTADQRQHFRLALARPLARIVREFVLPEGDDFGERACLDALLRWIAQPTPERAAEVARDANRIEETITEIRHAAWRDKYWEDPEKAARSNAQYLLSHGIRLVRDVVSYPLESFLHTLNYAADPPHKLGQPSSRDSVGELLFRDMDRVWQLETAWAILNNPPLPRPNLP